MLFKRLGDITAKHAIAIVLIWGGLLAFCFAVAPKWDDVIENGEFAFLPNDSPSRIAMEGFRDAFPNDMLASTLVLLIRRESGGDGLLPSDFDYIALHLIPEIHRIAGVPLPNAERAEESGGDSSAQENGNSPGTDIVQRIQWFADRKIGDLLISEDKQATLIVMGLRTEFLDALNARLVRGIEDFVDEVKHTPSGQSNSLPAGLEISVSGSATFGRDMMKESRNSAKATEKWTVILVVGLLIAIYRAPTLAMIPLLSVAVATAVSLKLLSIAAVAGWVGLFNGIETYVTVVIYGSAVDYCLFLIARYREELEGVKTIEESISNTLHRVGAALTASAGTTICGIGMMIFADFGKFRQAGVAIPFGLTIGLLASLTLTPAILRLIGRWAFWPNLPGQASLGESGFPGSANLVARLQQKNLLTQGWQWIGGLVYRHAWPMWLGSLLAMLPFTVLGIVFFGNLSYGLLSELPDTAASVYGAEAVQRHFPAGEVAPLTVLVDGGSHEFRFRIEPAADSPAAGAWQLVCVDEGEDSYSFDEFIIDDAALHFAVNQRQMTFDGSRQGDTIDGSLAQADRTFPLTLRKQGNVWTGSLTAPVVDFAPVQGESFSMIQKFTESLVASKDELGLFSVRSMTQPKGQREQGRLSFAERQAQKKLARDYFVSSTNPSVTRVDLVFTNDPFARSSISEFRALRDRIRDHLPDGLKQAKLSFVGNTAEISDLKDVTDSDQIRIDVLVLLGVYLILVILLRRPGICGYLLFTVFYSYLATVGITFTVFWAMDPGGFSGLDWKVPMFLFTILIAVGEDYNILLMTRIDEEQVVHGPVKGIIVALEKTGSIISSCGIIMAGTFSSLMAGSLVGMDQLGFALALGVLLDTFVIRPIMLPSFLMLLTTGRLGVWSRWAGYEKKTEQPTSIAA